MAADLSLIREVDNAIAHGSAARRIDMLRRMTDLFIVGSSQFSDDDISIFDDVIARLAAEIEVSARALLASRLAPIPNAPPNTIRQLAFDDAIEVAAPILAQSAQLDDLTLAENAKKKGQGHMLAISRRNGLSETVTDILVLQGDRQVVLSTVGNLGARFSGAGFSTLVDRSEDDEELATRVGSRREIPRHFLDVLMEKASKSVRIKLEAVHPYARQQVRQAVTEATTRIQARILSESPDDMVGRPPVETAQKSSHLEDGTLGALVRAGAFAEATATLAAMCKLPVQFVEQAMTQPQSETILISAKSIGLSWSTVKAILMMRVEKGFISSNEIAKCLASFERLKTATAQEIVQFYRTRAFAA